jgi:hypothetical protein
MVAGRRLDPYPHFNGHRLLNRGETMGFAFRHFIQLVYDSFANFACVGGRGLAMV